MSRARQGSWVLASRVAPQAGGAILLILGARFLAPAALGQFVLIFAGVELLRRLVRAGWREAVIVGAEDTPPVVMTLSLASAFAAQLATAVAAAVMWHAGLEVRYPICLLMLGATLVPLAPTVVWEGLLLRRRQPEREARPLIVAEAAHLALAFLLLALGYGILGLALARIARALVLCLGLGRAAGWPVAARWDAERAAAALPVSANVTASALINFATTYGVDLIVGFYLGPASVAFFRVGSRIAGALSEAVTETVRVLAWSALPAGGGAERARLAERVERFFDEAVVLVAPVFVGLALVAGPLVALLLGPDWAPAAPVVALMAIARLFQSPATVAWPALAIIGRTGLLPRLTAIIAGSALVAILVTGPHGILAIAWSQVVAALFGGVATIGVLNRAIFAPERLGLRSDTLVGLALMALGVIGIRTMLGTVAPEIGPGIALVSEIGAGAFGYGLFLWWRRRDMVLRVTAEARRA